MFELHRDHGAITNLVPLTRPLSLFGLTANMQAYEPGELKSLQRQQLAQEQMDEQVLSVSLGPINSGVKFEDDSEDGEAYLDEQMADYAELEYFCQAS